jgi:hypothetical protein
MRSDRNRRVEQRAHEIWEAEGRPHGKHDEHWHRAEREIAPEGRGGTARKAAGTAKSASGKASPAKAPAKTNASAKKAGGATSRTAKPAASAGASSASARGRRKQPSAS